MNKTYPFYRLFFIAYLFLTEIIFANQPLFTMERRIFLSREKIGKICRFDYWFTTEEFWEIFSSVIPDFRRDIIKKMVGFTVAPQTLPQTVEYPLIFSFSKTKLYRIELGPNFKVEELGDLPFFVKNLVVFNYFKDLYLLIHDEKRVCLLQLDGEVVLYQELPVIKRIEVADKNNDGADEIYIYYPGGVRIIRNLPNWGDTETISFSDTILVAAIFGNKQLIVAPDSILVNEIFKKSETNQDTRRLLTLRARGEKYLFGLLEQEKIKIIAQRKDRLIGYLIRYRNPKRILTKWEIFDKFKNTRIKTGKSGLVIASDNDLLYVPRNFEYVEKISDLYPIKSSITHLKYIDLNGDSYEDLITLIGPQLLIFINNSIGLAKEKLRLYQRLLNRIKNGDLTNWQEDLIDVGNLQTRLNIKSERTYTTVRGLVAKIYLVRLQKWLLTSALLLSFLTLFMLLVIKPFFKSVRKKKWRLLNRRTSSIIKIAEDLIALDHNYLLKGNINGARKSIVRIAQAHKLIEPEIKILEETSDFNFFCRNFCSLLKKLLQNQNTANLLEELQRINATCSSPLEFCELFKPEFNLLSNQQKKNRALILLKDPMPSKVPSYRVFFDSKLRKFLEHIFIDHLKYAKELAVVTLEAQFVTDWNRRLIISFYSDAATAVDFTVGHLANEVFEIKESFGDYLRLHKGTYQNEKLTVEFNDLITIIEEILQREQK